MYRTTIPLIIVTILFTFHAKSNVCYDITTDHQCKEKKEIFQGTVGFNNENLKRNYEVQLSADSILSRVNCGNNSSSERNIANLHQLINQLQLEEREKFICKTEVTIRAQMQQILKDRQFMKDYIEREKSNAPISKEDKEKMAYLLIKYRLFRNKHNVCSSYAVLEQCYFSSARFSVPQEVFAKMYSVAQKYIELEEKPHSCFFNGREHSLTSDACKNEILSRVQAIPIPLMLAQAAQESGWGNEENNWVSGYNNLLGLQIKFNSPSTMSCYKNCRCAGDENNRCALKFENIEGCVYEYVMRFNASPLEPYEKFRKVRRQLEGVDVLQETIQQCQNARALVPQLKDYAEDDHYIHHICNRLNSDICEMLKKCPSYSLATIY